MRTSGARSVTAAAARIDAEGLRGHIRVLASDEMEGRGPGTLGEERTVRYLPEQFRRLGLEPGNPDGTFVQKVPLVGFQAETVAGAFQSGGRTIALESPGNFVAVSRRMAPEVRVDGSEVVFVGYGVVAPEGTVAKRPGTVPILRSLRSKMGLSPFRKVVLRQSPPE